MIKDFMAEKGIEKLAKKREKMKEVSNLITSSTRVQTLNLLSLTFRNLRPDLNHMLSRWEKATSR